MSFKEDLKAWKVVEKVVAKHFHWQLKDWYCKEYDIKIEVKNDIIAHKTGNVWFEYLYKWHKSWILAGNNYLVYKVWNKLWGCRTKKLIEELKKKPYRKVKWWDWNYSDLILVPIYDFISIFNYLCDYE